MSTTVFFGTPQAAVPALQALQRISDVAAVVTRSDTAKGRSSLPTPSPVKEEAQRLGLDVVHAPPILALSEADLAIVVAYGRLLPPAVLEATRVGVFNIHFSLLPRWRGAAPVQRALLAGDARTGVTLMEMDKGLDTGPSLAWCATLIGAEESAGDLTERLADIGADLLSGSLRAVLAGALEPAPQDERKATKAPTFTTDDARLDFGKDASALLRQIRAFSPLPGAWALLHGARFKILAARSLEAALDPGAVMDVAGKVGLGTVTGAIELVTVQAAGKPVMAAQDWFNGHRRHSAALS